MRVPEENINRSVLRNPHGWGISMKTRKGIKTIKGFDDKEAWPSFRSLPVNTERIFHARIATSGYIDEDNIHPFDASFEDTYRVLFHNGTVSLPSLNPAFSDSWHLAMLLRGVPTGVANKTLAEYARKEFSRFVLQSADRDEKTSYFGHGWQKRDGAMYSNESAFEYTATKQTSWGARNPDGMFSWNTRGTQTALTSGKETSPGDDYKRRIYCAGGYWLDGQFHSYRYGSGKRSRLPNPQSARDAIDAEFENIRSAAKAATEAGSEAGDEAGEEEPAWMTKGLHGLTDAEYAAYLKATGYSEDEMSDEEAIRMLESMSTSSGVVCG